MPLISPVICIVLHYPTSVIDFQKKIKMMSHLVFHLHNFTYELETLSKLINPLFFYKKNVISVINVHWSCYSNDLPGNIVK